MSATLNDEWGFEGGLLALYTDDGWSGSGHGIASGGGNVHKDDGAGGDYSLYVGDWLRGPIFSTGKNYLYHWYTPKWLAGPGRYSSHTVTFFREGSDQLSILFAYDGSITIYRGVTVVASAPAGTFDGTQGHWVAIYLVAHSVTGRCIISMDEAQVLDSGVANTQNAASTSWDQFGFGTFAPLSGEGFTYVDDILLVTESAPPGTPLGEAIIPAVRPASDVGPNTFPNVEPASLNHFDRVNEVPVSKTQYVESDTAAQEELYGVSALPATGTILGIGVWSWAVRSGASITKAQNWIKSGATSDNGAEVTLPASSSGVARDIWVEDPDTAAPWVELGVNALQVGFRSVT